MDRSLIPLCWQRGQLAYKLHPVQLVMRKAFYASKADENVWNTARRLGKTFLLVLLAFECCLRKPRRRVPFAAQTASEVYETIEPIVETILRDCPSRLLPKLRWHRGRIEFRNGSVIKIAGCDKGNFRHLRGQRADLWLVDEGGFIDELERVVDGVLVPQTWTTGGRGVIASTPPETPGHHFQTRYLLAKQNGASARYTIFDNPILTKGRINEIIEKAAERKGMSREIYLQSSHWLREGMAEFVVDAERAVLPEYTEERERAATLALTSRPIWTDRYVSMDLGPTRDWTAVLYAIYDFHRRKLCILKERLLLRPTKNIILNAIREDEDEVFGKAEHLPPGCLHFRWMDGNDIIIRDLAEDNMVFDQTEKDDRDSAIMDVRNWIVGGRIEIDPSCKMLNAQMRAAIWNKRHTEFARIEGFGHFDFVSSLIYLVRNCIPNADRLPPDYGKSEATHWIGIEKPLTKEEEILQEIFG